MPSTGSSCSPLGRADRENGHLTIRSVQPGARVTRAQSAGRPDQHRHCCLSPFGPAAEQGLDASLQVGSGEQGLDGDRLELPGSGQHLGIEPAQLADRRLILLDGGALDWGEPRHGVPPAGLVLEQHEIAGLVLVHPDDPGHSGVIEPARLGQGSLQQGELSGGDLDTLADVLGEPANLADGVPVLLTLAAHPAERRARGPGAGWDLRSPAPAAAPNRGHAATAVPAGHPISGYRRWWTAVCRRDTAGLGRRTRHHQFAAHYGLTATPAGLFWPVTSVVTPVPSRLASLTVPAPASVQ